jgi:hypothetical protein
MQADIHQLEQITKECYRDNAITMDDLIEILSGNDVSQKKKLFNKILTNSTERLSDIKKLFKKDLIVLFLKDVNPKYNLDLLVREEKLLRSILLNEKVEILELAWKKYLFTKNYIICRMKCLHSFFLAIILSV